MAQKTEKVLGSATIFWGLSGNQNTGIFLFGLIQGVSLWLFLLLWLIKLAYFAENKWHLNINGIQKYTVASEH